MYNVHVYLELHTDLNYAFSPFKRTVQCTMYNVHVYLELHTDLNYAYSPFKLTVHCTKYMYI